MPSSGAGAAQHGGAGIVAAPQPLAAPAHRPLPPRLLTRTPPAGPVRLAALTALALVVARRWVTLVDPVPRGAVAGSVTAALATGAVLVIWPRLPRTGRAVAVVALVPAVLLGLLAAAGVPVDLLRPREWSGLPSGIGQGLQALPELRVPYRGADDWVRAVVVAGGGLLLVASALLACWPGGARRGAPSAAAALLGGAYALAAIQVSPERPFGAGALLTVLLAGLLWADRLSLAQVPLAAGLLGLGLAGGLLAAPRLDAGAPWIDYRHLADSLAPKSSVHFDWSHRYTPLDWPRDGNEALRLRAASASYWKGVTLARFDGTRWRDDGRAASASEDTEITGNHPEWTVRVTVVARDISSRQIYAPGDVLSVSGLGRQTGYASGGTRVVAPGERPLSPGDSYRVVAYAPAPSVTQLRAAGTDYPPWTLSQTAIELPRSVGGPVLHAIGTIPGRDTPTVTVARFGSGDSATLGAESAPFVYPTGLTALRRSDYGRVLALARSLRAGAATPYDVVSRVLRRVRSGARYSESPPRARLPLVDFLFGARRGYCQQFSGAMALLLRMDGIPARVAEGFAPGTFDRARHEYVARDYDAHSWVEVYFPRIGWVAFDPTPSSAPPASQAADTAATAVRGDTHDQGGTPRSDAPAGAARSTSHTRLYLGLAFAMACLVTMVLVIRGPRTRTPPGTPPELAELVRALTLTGRAPHTAMTLHGLEAGLAGDPEAQGYVRALRGLRFGGTGEGPTVTQRAALRRALGAGLGPLARARTLVAMPPRYAELRDRRFRRLRRPSYTR